MALKQRTRFNVCLALAVLLVMAKGDQTRQAAESWVEWAKDKIISGGGGAKDSAKKAFDSATETAKNTKDKVQDFASGAGQYAAEKAKETKDDKPSERTNGGKEKDAELINKVKEKMGTTADKAADTKEAATETKEAGKEKVSELTHEAKETKEKAAEKEQPAGKHACWAKERAKQGYEAAKSKAEETLEAVKQKSQDVKDNFAGPARDEEL